MLKSHCSDERLGVDRPQAPEGALGQEEAGLRCYGAQEDDDSEGLFIRRPGEQGGGIAAEFAVDPVRSRVTTPERATSIQRSNSPDRQLNFFLPVAR